MTTLCIVTKQCPRTTWSQKHNTLRLCTKRWWHSHVKYHSSHTKQNVSTPHNVHISHGQVNVQLCVNNQTYNVLRTTSRKHWALCRCWSGLVAIFLNLGEWQKSHGSIQYKSQVIHLILLLTKNQGVCVNLNWIYWMFILYLMYWEWRLRIKIDMVIAFRIAGGGWWLKEGLRSQSWKQQRWQKCTAGGEETS